MSPQTISRRLFFGLNRWPEFFVPYRVPQYVSPNLSPSEISTGCFRLSEVELLAPLKARRKQQKTRVFCCGLFVVVSS